MNSLDASLNYKDNYFDYIYIDGEHTYEAVTKDLECWFPKLKNKGLLFGDDADNDDDALNERGGVAL